MDYTPELGQKIAEQLINHSLRQIAAQDGMPSRSTMQLWLHRHDDFRQACELAWEIKGFDAGDQIRELREQLLAGNIAPDVHREARQSCEREAGSLAPKKWGQKVAVEHGGTLRVGAPEELSDAELARIAAGSGERAALPPQG